MYSKLKEKVMKKAFNYAFSRYDTDGSGFLNRSELTSLVNDTFSLIGYPRQISSIEARVAMKMFDDNGDDKITKQEAYIAMGSIISKAGSFSSMMGGSSEKDSKCYAVCPPDEDEDCEIETKDNFKAPDDIDMSKLKSLPPPGYNIPPGDQPPQKQEEGNAGFIL